MFHGDGLAFDGGPIVKPWVAAHEEREAWGHWGEEGEMTGTMRSMSVSLMAPTPGGKCKERCPVAAGNGQAGALGMAELGWTHTY